MDANRWKVYSAILIIGVALYLYMINESIKNKSSTNDAIIDKAKNIQKDDGKKEKNMKKLFKKTLSLHEKEALEDFANAREVWKRLLEVGFNSDESAELIDILMGFNGGYIYYKELRGKLREKDLRDDVAAQIILALSGTYEGRGGDGSAFHVPKNDRDKKTQSAILEEIASPHGKASLYMALEKMGYATDHKTVMQTLQSMKEDEDSLLDDLSLYELELKEVGLDGTFDETRELITEIGELEEDKQTTLMPTFTEFCFKVGELENRELQQKYISLIKNNMPKEYEPIDHDKIHQMAIQKVKEDIDFMDIYNTMNDREEAYYMFQDRVQAEYEDMSIEANGDNFLRSESYRAIAYALSPDPADYLIGYKKAFLSETNWDEKVEYLDSFWNEVHTIGEDDVKDKFLSDKEIKSALEDGFNIPKVSEENRKAIDFYLKKFH